MKDNENKNALNLTVNEPSKETRDLRLSGPLDLRLIGVGYRHDTKNSEEIDQDQGDISFPPENASLNNAATNVNAKPPLGANTGGGLPGGKRDGGIAPRDQILFKELLEEFRLHIDMPSLEMDAPNCCSIEVGDDDKILITIELRSPNTLVLFTALETFPRPISEELARRIDMFSRTHENNSEKHYLTTSRHSVFLCVEDIISRMTSTRFVDWVSQFYKQAKVWGNRYKTNFPASKIASFNDLQNTASEQSSKTNEVMAANESQNSSEPVINERATTEEKTASEPAPKPQRTHPDAPSRPTSSGLYFSRLKA